MKKLFFVLAVLPAWFAVFGEDALPRLAVVEFSTNNRQEKTVQDAVMVRNLVESQMIAAGKYQIITRDEIDKLLAKQQIAVSSISSSENVKKLQLQNISYIVTGSVDAAGNSYVVTVKILDVGTGRFSHSADAFMPGEPAAMYAEVRKLVAAFTAGMAPSGERVVQAERPAMPAAEIRVGGPGPAGGIVFYDKGIYSDGWRYMEAAPRDLGTAEWGPYETVGGTGTAAGNGKRNTELIVNRLRQLGESGRAAQLCDAYSYGGYSDWFLPSEDELDLMYRNLAAKGLGGFNTTENYQWYWSSSEYNTDIALGQRFSDGLQGGTFKNYTHSVRAVRAF
jgi:hypothetical protein